MQRAELTTVTTAAQKATMAFAQDLTNQNYANSRQAEYANQLGGLATKGIAVRQRFEQIMGLLQTVGRSDPAVTQLQYAHEVCALLIVVANVDACLGVP